MTHLGDHGGIRVLRRQGLGIGEIAWGGGAPAAQSGDTYAVIGVRLILCH